MIHIITANSRDLEFEYINTLHERLSERDNKWIANCKNTGEYTCRLSVRYLLFLFLDWMYPENRFKLAKDESGCPFLEPHQAPALSLSHSNGRLMIALSDSGRIGCDIEHVSRIDERVICRFLSGSEKIHYNSLVNPDEKIFYLAELWTVKEACSKWLAKGLLYNFARLDVSKTASLVLIRNENEVTELRYLSCRVGNSVQTIVSREIDNYHLWELSGRKNFKRTEENYFATLLP